MLNTTLILSTITIIYLIYLFYKYKKWIKRVDSIPGPPGLPLVGNLLEFPSQESIFPKYLNFFQKYGRTFRLLMGHQVYIVTCDAKILQHFVGRTKDMPKPNYYKFLENWFGRCLPFSRGERWKNRRRIFHSALHFKVLEDSVAVFSKASDLLVLKLKEHVGRSFDIRQIINQCSLDIICETSMGVSINAQTDPHNEYRNAISDLDRIFMCNMNSFLSNIPFLYRFTENYRREEQARRAINDFSRSVIKERKLLLENREIGKSRRLNLLDLLLQAEENGQPLSEDDVREEVNVSLFAGHETTATSIVYALWALANNSEVQEKLLEELESVLGKDLNREETLEDLQRMKYLDMVISESSRLYPAVAFFGRQFDQDEEFGGFKFQKGQTLIPFFYALHRDPEYFPKPEKFDPERFSPENASKQNLSAHMPFGLGPRICVGKKFALLEEKAVISKIVRNFILYPEEPNHELDFAVGTVLTARNGVRIRFETRSHK